MYSALDADAYTSIPTKNPNELLIPEEIPDNSYIYQSSTNLLKGRTFYLFHGSVISFNTPKEFLQMNKNTIYANSFAEVSRWGLYVCEK